MPGLICVGAIVGAHGVAGAVRIKSFTAEPADVASYGPVVDETGMRSFEIEPVGGARGAILARLPGIDTRDAADALKGTRLYVARSALPPAEDDEYYHADLLGLAAETADGAKLGRVVAVHETGGTEVLEVGRDDGRSDGRGGVLLPFTRAVVREIELARGRIVVDPPPGLIDGAAAEAEVEGEAEGR